MSTRHDKYSCATVWVSRVASSGFALVCFYVYVCVCLYMSVREIHN